MRGNWRLFSHPVRPAPSTSPFRGPADVEIRPSTYHSLIMTPISSVPSWLTTAAGSLTARGLLLLMILSWASPAVGQIDFGLNSRPETPAFNDSRDQVTASVLVSRSKVAAGGDLIVAVVLDMKPSWHVWPGIGQSVGDYAAFDGAIRTEATPSVAEGDPIQFHPGFTVWPEVHGVKADLGDGPRDYGVYEGRVGILIPATIAADAAPGSHPIEIQVGYQTCDDQTCLAPAFMTLSAEVEVLAAGATAGDSNEDDPVFARFDPTVFAKIRGGAAAPEVIDFDVFGASFSIDVAGGGGFVLLLLVAALGGMLLNFTPCVLPVIPLKIMGLSAAADNRGRCLALGTSMSVGVVFFWIVLGAMIAGLKSFQSISELFQYPVFTITVGVVIVVMAIGMAGFFTIKLPNKVYAVQTSHDTLAGSFVFGIMTAILSTPCTAPLMGAAAAWATTQSPATVLTVFAAIGGGMALPYLILSAVPDLVKKMPRTGPASEVVKQVMGLLLLAAGAYFVGSGISGLTVVPGEPPSRIYWWVVAAAAAGSGVWLVARTWMLTRHAVPRVLFTGVGGLITALSVWVGVIMTAKGPIDWIYYTPARFADAIAADKVVVLDFTAEWCLNCKTLEATVLQTDAVVKTFDREDVVPMKIDLTGENPDGKAKLAEAARLTIPLLVVYGKDGDEIWKSDAYTPTQVLDAVGKAEATYGRGSAALRP